MHKICDQLNWRNPKTKSGSPRFLSRYLSTSRIESQIRKVGLVCLAAFLAAGCGFMSGTSSATSKDKSLCEDFMAIYTREIPKATYFINNQKTLEGSRAGFDAALNFAYAAESIADAASRAGESASNKGKKLFSALQGAYSEAAVAIAQRGGSVGPSEIDKINAMVSTFEEIEKFCK